MIARSTIQSAWRSFVALGIALPIVPLADAATMRVPDDHRSIQSAIDAAESGDTVIVAAGTYRERVRLKSGVEVRSAGDDTPGELGLKRAEATILDGDEKAGDGPGVEMAEGSILDGFTVTRVGKFDESEWQKHYDTHGDMQPHEHIGEPGVAGISATGVTCTIRNNIVHHIGYTGIAIVGSKGRRTAPHVLRNVCYRNMGGGIGSMNGSAATIEGNVCFQNFYAGIGHDNAHPRVVRNICYDNVRAGIGISEGSCPVVRENRCYQNRRAGIGTRTGRSTQPIIEDNDCYENEMAGIGVEEEAAPIVRGNRCYRNKLAGIGVRDHGAPTILANECYENKLAGIGQAGDAETLLVENHCHHNEAAGIGFDECEAGRATLIRNRVIENAKVAVGIHAGWTVRLEGNELSRQGGLPPIVMVFEGAEATFTGNVIRGGGVAGVRVAGKAHLESNELAGEAVRAAGPPNFAVWALPGADISMTRNSIDNWRHALHASEATVAASHNTVSQFHRAAFVVQNPASPPNVHDNRAVSENDDDQVLSLDGPAGEVGRNELQRGEKPATP